MASIIIDEIVPTKWRLRLRDAHGAEQGRSRNHRSLHRPLLSLAGFPGLQAARLRRYDGCQNVAARSAMAMRP